VLMHFFPDYVRQRAKAEGWEYTAEITVRFDDLGPLPNPVLILGKRKNRCRI